MVLFVLCGICADWTERTAASLYADTHRRTENVHTKAELILTTFVFLPVPAQTTRYLSQQGDPMQHVQICTAQQEQGIICLI